jgi:hypothetical protein
LTIERPYDAKATKGTSVASGKKLSMNDADSQSTSHQF